MFAILISVMMFPGQEPKVIAMPFVMPMDDCLAEVERQPKARSNGITVMTTCYALDRDAVEDLRFSADVVLKGWSTSLSVGSGY